MRKPITMRFDPDLLAKAKLKAAGENRTLTNFIETVVRERVADVSLPLNAADACSAKSSPVARPEGSGNR
jgi:hypothetical protein